MLERFANVLSGPGCCRVLRGVEMQNLSTIVTQDDKAVEHAKHCCRNGKEIAGHDLVSVFLEKCLPIGRWWSTAAGHVVGNCRFGDIISNKRSSEKIRGAPQVGFSRDMRPLASYFQYQLLPRYYHDLPDH